MSYRPVTWMAYVIHDCGMDDMAMAWMACVIQCCDVDDICHTGLWREGDGGRRGRRGDAQSGGGGRGGGKHYQHNGMVDDVRTTFQ